ncbi:penicillin-binding protein 2 [Candidatus Falkowbacteria bacterium]|nr:penicillin-binding protein 2 [Candidatus Falkowbacteria bacterium]
MQRHFTTRKPDYSLHSWRVRFLWWVIVVLTAIVIVRLFWLQVVRHSDYQNLAALQHDIYQEVLPDRGIIYTQNTRLAEGAENKYFPVANNQRFYLIYGQTFAVEDAGKTAEQLNAVLDLPPDVLARIIEQLSKPNDPYEPLVHRVTEDKIAALSALALPGIKWEEETLRYYPDKNIGSNILGFVGWVNDTLVGQYGLEGYFNKELSGEKGFLRSERDATGRLIGVGEQNFKEALNGTDLYLTIDNSIQAFACQTLGDAVTKYDADGGAVIVTNPRTGAVLALCNNPDYDPNDYSAVENIRSYTIPAIFDAYEPGSVFKPLTLAAALEEGKITPETTYEDTGEVKIDGYSIKNSDLKGHGMVSMVDVLKLSLNTGAIFGMRQIGPAKFADYVRNFGFGELTGIQLDSEAAGNITPLKKNKEIYAATASFGQGITVTPLQMVNAYAAIANGGTLMKPYIVERTVDALGSEYRAVPQEIRRVVSERTATLISGMMVQVVEAGYGQRAKVPGYYIAGKTGTAQVAEPGSGVYGSRTMHTFVGFGPVSDPQFVMLVRLDHPTAARFAESTATPAWGQIAKFILNYYQIRPDEVK